MSELLDREYNYAVWKPSQTDFQLLKEVHHSCDVDLTSPCPSSTAAS